MNSLNSPKTTFSSSYRSDGIGRSVSIETHEMEEPFVSLMERNLKGKIENYKRDQIVNCWVMLGGDESLEKPIQAERLVNLLEKFNIEGVETILSLMDTTKDGQILFKKMSSFFLDTPQ